MPARATQVDRKLQDDASIVINVFEPAQVKLRAGIIDSNRFRSAV
jgi:hypothetical protein